MSLVKRVFIVRQASGKVPVAIDHRKTYAIARMRARVAMGWIDLEVVEVSTLGAKVIASGKKRIIVLRKKRVDSPPATLESGAP